MKFRTLITGAIAVALAGTGTMVSSAKAAGTVDADVGGGVAALQATVDVGAPTLLNPLANKDYAELNVVYARAVMGRNGGKKDASLLNKTIGPVSVKAASETISGKRTGNPFATARSVLTGVKINAVNIGALDVTCTWNEADGASGSTTLIDVNGNATKPAVNETHDIPGLGTLVFNEQDTDGWSYQNAAGDTVYQQVLYVFGAHLYLSADAQLIYNTTDVILGFTSCDPVKLPNLSGLALLQNLS